MANKITVSNLFKGTKGTGAFDAYTTASDTRDGFGFTMVGADAVMSLTYKGTNDRTFMQHLAAKFNRSTVHTGNEEDVRREFVVDKTASLAQLGGELGYHPAPLANFLRAWAFVEPAASTDETRTNLCGVRLDAGGMMVATDGHRMHWYPDAIPELATAFTLPSTVGYLLSRAMLAAYIDGARTYHYAVSATTGGLTVTSVLIESSSLSVALVYRDDHTFPDYQQVIPPESEWAVRITGRADEFIDGLEGQPVKVDKKFKSRIFCLTADTLHHLDLDGVTKTTALPVVVESSDQRPDRDLIFNVNDTYLREVVDGDGEFTLTINDERSPLVWRQGKATALVMPMKA